MYIASRCPHENSQEPYLHRSSLISSTTSIASAPHFGLRIRTLKFFRKDYLKMYRISASLLALAPLVLSSPVSLASRDYSGSCSDLSLKGFEWQVDDFDFHASYIFTTPAHQNSWGYASFNLSNPAVPDVVASCSAQSSQLQDFFFGTQIYQCTVNGTAGPAPASFAFNRPTGELDVNQTWVCNDVDPKYP